MDDVWKIMINACFFFISSFFLCMRYFLLWNVLLWNGFGFGWLWMALDGFGWLWIYLHFLARHQWSFEFFIDKMLRTQYTLDFQFTILNFESWILNFELRSLKFEVIVVCTYQSLDILDFWDLWIWFLGVFVFGLWGRRIEKLKWQSSEQEARNNNQSEK